jgi:hypothetical protein
MSTIYGRRPPPFIRRFPFAGTLSSGAAQSPDESEQNAKSFVYIRHQHLFKLKSFKQF